jgi:uncharacterized membrane protein
MDQSIVLGLLAFFTFSLAGITAKVASTKLGGFNATLMYGFAYLMILLPSFFIFVRRIDIFNIKWGLLAGVVSCIGILLTNKALETGKASVIIPLVSSYPILMAIWARIFLGETLIWYQYFGMILAVIGIILLTVI